MSLCGVIFSPEGDSLMMSTEYHEDCKYVDTSAFIGNVTDSERMLLKQQSEAGLHYVQLFEPFRNIHWQ